MSLRRGFLSGAATLAVVLLGLSANQARSATSSDPVLQLLLEKGIVTQEEVDKAKAQAEAIRTNNLPTEMPPVESKWKISKAIKDVELFGDLRVRYEGRSVEDPGGGHIDLNRLRYAARVGLRGDVFDNFYYGFRLDTAPNPRSSWVTFGTSSSSTPYQGPFGKSNAGIFVDQLYIGWRPESWFDITIGKMPQPLYTTAMVWDSDLSPEGLAEHFKYTVGEADFFANFGQFIYADFNPSSASGGLGFNGLIGQETRNVFMFASQIGVKEHITTTISAKVAATLYLYTGLQRSTVTDPASTAPYFGDPFVGEGAYLGPGTGTINGSSGYGTSGSIPGYGSQGFPNNQVGLNNLVVLEIPFEFNFKINKLDAQVFGDASYNFQGSERAQAAAAGYNAFLASQQTPPTITGFAPQTDDVKAYQIGFALASQGNLGMVYGNTSRKHAWEIRTYWQHIEQYALDPNLLDSDFFEGRANLQGFYAAAAYGLTDNMICTLRYGYAHRINDKLGTGGSNQDIPQVNPIEHYNLLQVDLTLRF